MGTDLEISDSPLQLLPAKVQIVGVKFFKEYQICHRLAAATPCPAVLGWITMRHQTTVLRYLIIIKINPKTTKSLLIIKYYLKYDY